MLVEPETLLRELWAQVRTLRDEVSELRVEISEMEATLAELTVRVDNPDRIGVPWPVSVMLLPAALTLALLRQVDELARALSAECTAGERRGQDGQQGPGERPEKWR